MESSLIDRKLIDSIQSNLEKQGVIDLIRSHLRIHVLNSLKGNNNYKLSDSLVLDDKNRAQLIRHTRDLLILLKLNKTVEVFDNEINSTDNFDINNDSKLTIHNVSEEKNSNTNNFEGKTVFKAKYSENEVKGDDSYKESDYKYSDESLNESSNESLNESINNSNALAKDTLHSHSNLSSKDEEEEVPENDSVTSNSFEDSKEDYQNSSTNSLSQSFGSDAKQKPQQRFNEIEVKAEDKFISSSTFGQATIKRLDQGIITRTTRQWNGDSREDDNDYNFIDNNDITSPNKSISVSSNSPLSPPHQNTRNTTISSHVDTSVDDIEEIDSYEKVDHEDGKQDESILNNSKRSSNQDDDNEDKGTDDDTNNDYDDEDDNIDEDINNYLPSSHSNPPTNNLFTRTTKQPIIQHNDIDEDADYNDDFEDDHNDHIQDNYKQYLDNNDDDDADEEDEIEEEVLSIGESIGSHGSDDPLGLNDSKNKSQTNQSTNNNLFSTTLSRTKSGKLSTVSSKVEYQYHDDDEEEELKRLAEVERRLAEIEKEDAEGKLNEFKKKYNDDNVNSYVNDDDDSIDISVASENLDELDFSVNVDNKVVQSEDNFSISEQEIESSLNVDNYEFVTNVQPADRRYK